MTWNRQKPSIDYEAFERGEPITATFDLLYDDLSKLKARVRNWLSTRGHKSVKFVTERRKGLYIDTLIAYWTPEQQSVDMIARHPAYPVLTTGAYEHFVGEKDWHDAASIRSSFAHWLYKQGVKHVSTRILDETKSIAFWNPNFKPKE